MDGTAGIRLSVLIGAIVLLSAVALVLANPDPSARATANDTDRRVAGPQSPKDATSTEMSAESLFDAVFLRRQDGASRYDVPFPFTTLTERIAATLSAQPDQSSPLLQVLIPLGRSLQRFAAEPDYFKHPRVIVAVDSPPADGSQPLLKDRLYLGYQEKANTIEVISYSETAGRFEFQVVEDYGSGLTPVVRPASRPLCMGCHQNGGPIWSNPPWEETNGNPKIASLLQTHGRSFFGVPVDRAGRGTDHAFGIAESIDRANRFGAHQALWRHACGNAADCRAGLFKAMLQYRLSGNRGYAADAGFEDEFLAGWRQRWPDGLPLPDARIPNRNPVTDGRDIAGMLDPLEPRPSKIAFKPSDVDAVDDAVAGLASFLPDPDIRALDTHLFRMGRDPKTPRRRLETACAFSKTDLGGFAVQIRFSCGGAADDAFGMDGQFYVEAGKPAHGTIERLQIGEAEFFIKLALAATATAYAEKNGSIRFALRQPIGNIQVRLKNGNALERLRLRWRALAAENSDPSAELHRHADNGVAHLDILDDAAALHAPLQAMARGQIDALSPKPLRGGILMRALFEQLQIPR